MKNKVWIIIAAVFIVIMILAAVIYPRLSEKYSRDNEAVSENISEVVQANDFIVYDSEMNEVKLSDYFGKPIVINFWASWCAPCKSELPAFNTMYEKYKDDVVFIMINLNEPQSDTVSSIKEFVEQNNYSFPVYYDSEYSASNAYGIYSIPETVFISEQGMVYDIRVGAMSETVLENYILQIIGEE